MLCGSQEVWATSGDNNDRHVFQNVKITRKNCWDSLITAVEALLLVYFELILSEKGKVLEVVG